MRKSISLISMIAISIAVLAQGEIKDPKAKEILDNLSEKTRSYKTISSDFSFTMENQQEDITETYDGKVMIKDDQYRLTLMGTETYCDGTTIWTHIVESEEVNVTNRDLEDKSFLNNPGAIFTMYEEGYKLSFKGEISDQGKKLDQVELYPDKVDQGLQPDNDEITDLSKIRILIDSELLQIHTFTYYTKNGNVYTISLSNFKPDKPIADSEFKFDMSRHPDIEVIDLRE